MKKKNFLSILVLVGFAILGYFLLRSRTDELVKIFEVDLKYVVIMFFFAVLVSLFRGQKLQILLGLYNIKMRFMEWWGLDVVSQFWNFLAPFQGGLSTQAIYLKKKYGFPYTFFASITGMNYLFSFLGNAALGFLISLIFLPNNEIKYIALSFFVIVIAICVFVLFFLPLPIKTNIKVLKYIARSVNEIQTIRGNYSFMIKLSLNFLARDFPSIFRLYFGFLAFGVNVPFTTCIIISSFSGIARVISITPMDLGFKEAIFAISSELLGPGAMLGAFVAALDRVIGVVWQVSIAPIFGYLLLKEFKIKENNSQLKKNEH